MDSRVQEIVELLIELQQDSTVPRNAKSRLEVMQRELESEGDLSLKVNKILSDVEEIAYDINLPMFIRTQIWSLTSMLEGLNA